jgi:hypothetical protein
MNILLTILAIGIFLLAVLFFYFATLGEIVKAEENELKIFEYCGEGEPNVVFVVARNRRDARKYLKEKGCLLKSYILREADIEEGLSWRVDLF